MKAMLKSTSYVTTILASAIIGLFGDRFDGNSCLWISVVCASYFVGRGIMQFSKSAVDPGYMSREFTAFLFGVCFNIYDIYLGGREGLIGIAIMVIAYNIGRGMADHFRSKVMTVLNR